MLNGDYFFRESDGRQTLCQLFVSKRQMLLRDWIFRKFPGPPSTQSAFLSGRHPPNQRASKPQGNTKLQTIVRKPNAGRVTDRNRSTYRDDLGSNESGGTRWPDGAVAHGNLSAFVDFVPFC